MTTYDIILRGVLFGLGAAVPIGPVNVEIARLALLTGWRSGVCLAAGATSIDVVYACLTVLGVSIAAANPYIYWPLALGGAAFLIYLGLSCFAAAIKAYRTGWILHEDQPLLPTPLYRVYLTGLAMTAINPMTLVFWFGGLASQASTLNISSPRLAYLAIGVFLGTITWGISFSALMSFLGRYRKPWWLAVADILGGLALLYFAALTLISSLQQLNKT